MKLLLSAILLSVSMSALAQDSVDLILTRLEGYTSIREQKFDNWKYAKVKFLRRYYDEMMKDQSMTLTCYSTLDKAVQMGIGQGQIAVFHKQGTKGERGGCYMSQCQNSNFEDFERIENDASNSTPNQNPGATEFTIGSVAAYEKWSRDTMYSWSSRNLYMPHANEIPYVTLYSPKLHAGKPQVTNSFHCYVAKTVDGKRSYIEP